MDKEFILQLIRRAQNNEHSELELINNTSTLRVAIDLRSALKKIYKRFKRLSSEFKKAYTYMLKKGVYSQLALSECDKYKQCYLYYKEEYKIVDYEISEFYAYMFMFGNFIDTLLGYDRPEEKMFDHLNVKFIEENEDE